MEVDEWDGANGLAPHSPDMNPIENVWSMWKARLRKIFKGPDNRPHGRDEVIRVCKEVWEGLPWKKISKWIEGCRGGLQHWSGEMGG